MPLKLSNARTFNWKVRLSRPNDAGTLDTFEFRAVYKRLDAARVKALYDDPPADAELLDKVWEGWVPEDVQDPEGNALEVSAQARTAFLAEPGMHAALVKGWIEAVITGPIKN